MASEQSREPTVKPGERTAAVVHAAAEARFFLHTVLLEDTSWERISAAQDAGDEHEAKRLYEKSMSQELAGEAMSALQQALSDWYAPDPPPPICSGCSPIKPWERGLGFVEPT